MRIVRSSKSAMAGATLAIALSVSAMTASAASTFLLQFGTHDSEEAAREQWDDLQSRYPEILGTMNVRIDPVAGEYRTQASGVTNGEAARNTCAQLTRDAVECRVVETSMYLPQAEDTPVMAASEIDDDISVEIVGEGMEDVSIENSASLSAQPELAGFGQPVQAEAETQTAAEAPRRSLTQTLLPWLADDEETAETPEMAAAEPAPQPRATAPAPELNTAFADAVAPAPAADTPAPRPERIEQPAWPETIDRSAAASMSENLPPQQPASRPDALAPGETRVVASRAPRALQLPGESARVNNSAAVAAATPNQAAAPVIVPVAEEPLQPQVNTMAQGQPAGEAQVEVAEAIPVPLSFGNAAPVPVNKPVGYGGFPSQPLPARTLWVQLSNFNGKDAAMQYWRQLSVQNPEMVRLLRVRIISPWRTPSTGLNNRTSLRMGPFADRNEISRLCSTAAQSGLRCSLVQEVGGSATANTVRRQGNVETQSRRAATSRGYSRTAGTQPAGMYWVQLGAFGAVAEAQKRWSNLQSTHGDIVGRMQPQISYPALSSSPTPVYHLRTGPFVSQASAVGTCNRLQNRRIGCVVVRSR